jgi:hypothetical protein
MRFLIRNFLILTFTMFLFGCGTDNSSGSYEEKVDKTEKIEAFSIETVSYEEGDYKLVNSFTILSGTGSNLKVEVRKIEDFYDNEGNYIKTRLLHSTTKDGDHEVFVEEPLTILLENQPIGAVKELSSHDKEAVKEHILAIFDKKF